MQNSTRLPQQRDKRQELSKIFRLLRNFAAPEYLPRAVDSSENPRLEGLTLSHGLKMLTGSNSVALGQQMTAGPTFFDYVSFIWKINMMGIPLEIPLDATDSDDNLESRMVYWREDPGVNLYHWHWHMVHPFSGSDYAVNKDRRGELFYYLHQQILARYNIERLCNGLNFANPLVNWNKPILETYHPVLNAYIASKNYPTRLANMKLRNVNRKDLGITLDLEDLRLYKERIWKSIYRRKVLAANGTEISIDNDKGIDILGNIIEASRLSPNEEYYGSIHNDGHIFIAVIHDPDNKYKQTTGVMFKPNTAMRDPLFYTWHSLLNSFFEKHKALLRPYSEKDLFFPGVKVTNVELTSYQNKRYADEKNTLYTYMTKSDLNMTGGLDFVSDIGVLVRVTHQDHDEFIYTIEYVNNFQDLMGTVRIFLLPITGFDNTPITLTEQRRFALEMDKFVQPLKAGVNKIIRRSTMSSMTIPFEQTFRDRNRYRSQDDRESDRINFCGCGWPQHLLVPRGTAEGYPMLLFAMITDANLDRIDPMGVNSNLYGCKPSESVCGLVDKKYPDKRPAGFPFDRPAGNDVDTIDSFLTPNMAIKPVTIFHSDEVRQGRLLSEAEPVILKKGNLYIPYEQGESNWL